MTIQQDYQIKPRASKEFSATGVILTDLATNMCNNLRVVVENVGVSNTVIVKGKLISQASYQTLDTITGTSTGYSIDVSQVDVIELECGVYSASGGTPKVIASGFFNSAGGMGGTATGFVIQAISATTVLTTAALGKSLQVTTGSSVISLTLPSATNLNGKQIVITKADSGSGRVEVNTSLVFLYAQNDTVTLQSNGSAWFVTQQVIKPLSEIFAVSGSYTIPPRATRLFIEGYGGGGGGGRGNATATTGTRSGGGGGGGAGYSSVLIPAATLTSPLTVTVGAGGAGAVTGTTGQAGAAGSSGTNSSVTNSGAIIYQAFAGGGGGAGSATLPSSGGQSAANFGGNGGLGNAGTFGNTGGNAGAGAGGGGAGGINGAATVAAGGAGGEGGRFRGINSGGAGGTTGAGKDGVNGTSATLTALSFGAGGGGGGGAADTTLGGTGGNGGAPGAGGGGSGASTLTGASGAGGNGGDGAVHVCAYFD